MLSLMQNQQVITLKLFEYDARLGFLLHLHRVGMSVSTWLYGKIRNFFCRQKMPGDLIQ